MTAHAESLIRWYPLKTNPMRTIMQIRASAELQMMVALLKRQPRQEPEMPAMHLAMENPCPPCQR